MGSATFTSKRLGRFAHHGSHNSIGSECGVGDRPFVVSRHASVGDFIRIVWVRVVALPLTPGPLRAMRVRAIDEFRKPRVVESAESALA